MNAFNKLTSLLFFTFLSVVFFPTLQAQNFLSNGIKNSQLGAYEDAIRDFSSAIQLEPQLEEAYFYRGEAYYRIHEYEKALTDFDKTIALSPSQSMNYYYRGLVRNALGQYQTAIQDFDKAQSIAPNFEDSYLGRAEAYWAIGSYSSAVLDCERALRVRPDLPEAFALRGLVNASRGNFSSAITDLEKAIQYEPQNVIFLAQLGDIYQQNDEYAQAITYYQKALSYDSKAVEANFGLAKIYLTQQDFEKARQAMNQILLKDSRFYPAYLLRAVLQYQDNLTSRAEADLNTFITHAYSGKDYFLAASFVKDYINDKNFLLKAKDWSEKAMNLLGTYQSYYLYASILFQLEDEQGAKQAATTAVEIAQQNSVSSFKAEELLKQIKNDANVDKTPPVIEIIQPTSLNRGFIVVNETEMISIEGKVFDESGVAKVLINGNPATLDETGYFKGQCSVDKGQTVILLKATDKHGNTAEREFMVEAKAGNNSTNATENDLKGILGSHKALLFASNDYEYWSDLINPLVDAEAIAADLQSIYGFEVEIIKNATKEEVLLTLRRYALQSYQDNDELFIFFAGHGHFDEVFKQGYLVTKDSRLNDETRSSYLAYTELRTIVDNINCKHVLLMMDVCFGGTFDPLVARRGEESEAAQDKREYISRKLKYKTRRYITSGGKEYVPDGRPGQHSPFARKVLEALRSEGGSDGILNIEDIMYYIQAISPTPLSGEFGDNEPGSDFLFIAR